jgi:hypothetical protein
MTDAIDRLKSDPPPMLVPCCTTCRHFKRREYRSDCDAVGGQYATIAYRYDCKGVLWEPVPPPVPLLVRIKRWLVG